MTASNVSSWDLSALMASGPQSGGCAGPDTALIDCDADDCPGMGDEIGTEGAKVGMDGNDEAGAGVEDGGGVVDVVVAASTMPLIDAVLGEKENDFETAQR